MLSAYRSAHQRIVAGLVGLSLVSIGFYAVGALQNRSGAFDYLVWNLFLAWIPLLLALWLIRMLNRMRWSQTWPLILTFGWLIMLPNTFYMISDFIHISEIPRYDLLYDVVMFTSFIFTAALIGFCSLYLVHLELKWRLPAHWSAGLIGFIIFLCSSAIYLGRDLRWNSWDVLTNPAGILFDVSDRILHPMQHSDMFVTIISFFVLLGSLYVAAWRIGQGATATRER